MATYEFWCTSCGHDFEAKRPLSEYSQPTSCPKCGATAQLSHQTRASGI